MRVTQTVTETLNAESNRAVCTLLQNAKNKKQSHQKRRREDDDGSVIVNKKRKIAPLMLQEEETHDLDQTHTNPSNGTVNKEWDHQQSNHNNGALGFSSDDDDDEDDEDEEEEEEEHELGLNALNTNNHHNHNHNHHRNNHEDDTQLALTEEEDTLNNDPYWNMLQTITESKSNLMDLDENENDNENHASNKLHNEQEAEQGVTVEIDIDDTSMFNLQDTDNKESKSKSKGNKKQKKEVRKYQKWQRDQGIELTQAHLSLLAYRARFRCLLCTDSELQARMMSIVPLKLHPTHDTFNGVYTEITFKQCRQLMHWFINQFVYDANVTQFELRCQTAKDRIPCGLFQLIEYIQDVGDKTNAMKSSVSHLNLLFLTLLWSFQIPARCVYVLRPISHILTTNRIYDDDYSAIAEKWFPSKPCVCQQLDEMDVDEIHHTDNIEGASNNGHNHNKKQSANSPNVNFKENTGDIWEEHDDAYLWNHRDDEVESLALYFGRTRTAIRRRLENLTDPNHVAYQRLHGDHPPVIDEKNKLVKRRPIQNGNRKQKASDDGDIDDESEEDEEEEEADSDISAEEEENIEPNKKKSSKKRKKQTKTKTKPKKKSKRKKSTKKKASTKSKKRTLWSIDDDIYLWEYRDDAVKVLANTLNRTRKAIRRRLEVLRDRSSTQRRRLKEHLPATSIMDLSPLRKTKKESKSMAPRRPDFSHLGQNFIYNKKGSMVECIEVYVSDRKEWVHVLLDRGRIHIDCSENNLHQCDCEKNSNKFNYCVAIDRYGCIKDVTPRYAETWSVALKNRVMHNDYYNEMLTKWQSENEQIAFQYGWQYVLEHKLWNDLQQRDQQQITKCIQSEPLPKSEGLFRNHPLYVIEKFVKKYEAIWPNDESQVIGKIKGQNVYPIENLHELHTRERWYKLGYVVKAGEEAIKQVKTSHMSRSEEEFTDLYGEWQCQKYIAPKIGPNDKLPVNHRGNIELWSDHHLPQGCVHIIRPNAVFALKRMKVPYAKAMVGFDQRKGRSVPVFDGYVLHGSHAKELHKVIDEMDEKRKVKEAEKEQKEMCRLWRILVQGIMVQHQLASSNREKQANKKILTIKEFNQEQVEEL